MIKEVITTRIEIIKITKAHFSAGRIAAVPPPLGTDKHRAWANTGHRQAPGVGNHRAQTSPGHRQAGSRRTGCVDAGSPQRPAPDAPPAPATAPVPAPRPPPPALTAPPPGWRPAARPGWRPRPAAGTPRPGRRPAPAAGRSPAGAGAGPPWQRAARRAVRGAAAARIKVPRGGAGEAASCPAGLPRLGPGLALTRTLP